ncbi:MAG: putative flippase AglR [Candidatus Argoarchaeum ethanivorans]|uniref:Putative flippase AglR n=1 Tax=Candidatus Argoarchaeum ethanivorans TaxID=2608793 RepID=A0A811TBW7_9EURY|nr:MAG: putative flippase AglR [Candidatus Argoarchaeum ethanivorans]
MQPHKKFAFDVGITFLASAVALPLGFIITILMGRYLGAGDLGLYRMTTTIYGIAMLVAAIGIPAAMIKYVAEFKDDRTKFNRIVSSGVITSLFLGIGFVALFYFASGIFAGIFNMPGLPGLLKLLSPVFPFALVGGALLGMLNGLREMKTYAAATIIQSVLMVIITVVLIYRGFGVAGAMAGVVLSSVGSCAFLIWVCRRHFDITLEGYRQTTKKLLGFGAQIVGANAINMINYQADIVLIGYFLTATDVGYYAVAVGLSKFFWIIPSAIQTITYPATSEYWANNNHSALQTMVDKSMKYTACVLLPIGLGVGFFAREIITLMFEGGFVYAVLPLQILIVGTVIFGIFKSIGGSLISIGRADLSLKITAMGALVNVLSNLLLIPLLGISGAAMATTLSFLLMAFLSLYLIHKLLQVRIDTKWCVKSLIILFVMIFAFMVGSELIHQYILSSILLCIYGILTIKFLLTKDDKKYFKSIFPSHLFFKT